MSNSSNGDEVSVFYLRDGYLPSHYTKETWEWREKAEKSKAFITPDVFGQITNLKYFQYVINKNSTWQIFGFSDEDFSLSRVSFCDIFTFEDFNNCKEKMKKFIEENGGVGNYVLKPQLEGGANNFFGEEITKKIEELELSELQSMILMERIHPT